RPPCPTLSPYTTLFRSQRIVNVGSPSNATDAVNKSYVDAKITGLHWKQAVRAATTASGTLSTAFAAGQTIDGVELEVDDRILIRSEEHTSELQSRDNLV